MESKAPKKAETSTGMELPITYLPDVGSFLSHFFVDLYEQCSLHITEKIPNSNKFGSLSRILRICLYSYSFKKTGLNS